MIFLILEQNGAYSILKIRLIYKNKGSNKNKIKKIYIKEGKVLAHVRLVDKIGFCVRAQLDKPFDLRL